MIKKLNPCPFCGGEAETGNKLDVEPIIDQNGAYIDGNTYYYEWTGCPKCDVWFSLGEDESEGSTVEKWNRRSEPKKGHWIGISDGYADGYPVYDEWECSCCGFIEEGDEPTWNYCPTCGARMEMLE